MELGTRMKLIEQNETGRRFLPLLPICARIDGKTFSKWTKGLDRPYDIYFIQLMQEVTKKLVEETNACCGYTQSDEISLLWYSDSYDSQVFFDGKIFKMVSVLASMATGYFNQLKVDYWVDKPLGFFDCRVWQVPNLVEAANVFVWREIDATRNSVQSATRSVYSHNECNNKNRTQMMDMLMAKGINWNDYPFYFKRGSYVIRKKVFMTFTESELEKLPEKHQAKLNPDLKYERTIYDTSELPPITRIINRKDVLVFGAEPIII